MITDEQAVEVIESMVMFMEQTNMLIEKIITRINNVEVDINKLRKKEKNIFISDVIGNNGGKL